MWSTQVYLGDPAVNRDFKMYCRVVYAKRLNKRKVYAAHDDLSRVLNLMGEDGYTLYVAVESVFDIWFYYGAIRPLWLETWMGRGGVVNETRPLPSWLRE